MSNVGNNRKCKAEERITLSREKLNELLVEASRKAAEATAVATARRLARVSKAEEVKKESNVGMQAICRILDCSRTTVWRIKKTGILESFLRYRGDSFVVIDPEGLRDKVDFEYRRRMRKKDNKD